MNVRTNRELTSHQIGDCLNIIGTASNFLTSKGEEYKDTSANGGHRVALEVTLAKACDRLEKILDDDTRWAVQAVDGHAFATAIAGEQFRQIATATRIIQQRLDQDAAMTQAAKEEAHRHVAELIAMMAVVPDTHNPLKKKRNKKV